MDLGLGAYHRLCSFECDGLGNLEDPGRMAKKRSLVVLVSILILSGGSGLGLSHCGLWPEMGRRIVGEKDGFPFWRTGSVLYLGNDPHFQPGEPVHRRRGHGLFAVLWRNLFAVRAGWPQILWNDGAGLPVVIVFFDSFAPPPPHQSGGGLHFRSRLFQCGLSVFQKFRC